MKKIIFLLLIIPFSVLVANAQIAGTLDTFFNINNGFSQTLTAKTIVLQDDGKIIVGGNFTTFNGTSNPRIIRLHPDGTKDLSFNVGAGAALGQVNAVQLQNDNKIIIGGSFSTYNGHSRLCIARINTNGTIDQSFIVGDGTNARVNTVAIQSDNKIIIGGNFTNYQGITRNRIARLNTNGSIDTTFKIGTGANNHINSIAVQNDGKIVIGGLFTSYNNIQVSRIARLNIDGSIDTTFSAGLGANASIEKLTIQDDGKIIIGGDFTSYNSVVSNRIARINADGSIDNTFNIGDGFDSIVNSLLILKSGKIMVGGSFNEYDNVSSPNLVRIHSDGSIDYSFILNSKPDNTVLDIVEQNDGDVIIGGTFQSYGNRTMKLLARLHGDKRITGFLYKDINENCVRDSGDYSVPNVKVLINPGNYLVESNEYGYWHIDSLPVGSYTVSTDITPFWFSTCGQTQNFTVTNADSLTIAPSFGYYFLQKGVADVSYTSFINNSLSTDEKYSLSDTVELSIGDTLHVIVSFFSDSIQSFFVTGSYFELPIHRYSGAVNSNNKYYSEIVFKSNPNQTTDYQIFLTMSTHSGYKDTINFHAKVVTDKLEYKISDDISGCVSEAWLGTYQQARGGVPPYTYKWYPEINLSCNTCPSPTLTPSPGEINYVLHVEDAIGQDYFDTVNVNLSNCNESICVADIFAPAFLLVQTGTNVINECVKRNAVFHHVIQLGELDSFYLLPVPYPPPFNLSHVDYISIDSIVGLPCGLSVSFNISPGQTFYPEEFGCMTISGVTNDSVGTYRPTIYFTAKLRTLSAFHSATVNSYGVSFVFKVSDDNSSCPTNLGNIKTGCGNAILAAPVIFPKNVSGTVYQSNQNPLSYAKIYAVKYSDLDSSITVIDSTYSDILGHYSLLIYDTVSLKVIPDANIYPNELPTYYGDAILFTDAQTLYFNDTSSAVLSNVDITTLPGLNVGGAGFIGGNIYEGANKRSSTPVENLNVILADTNDTPIAYTKTNQLGYFKIANLPHNSYNVWIDLPKIDNTIAPTIVLNDSMNTYNNLQFLLHSHHLELIQDTTSGYSIKTKQLKFNVYPNPFSQSTTISYTLNTTAQVQLKVTDMLGSIIMETAIETRQAGKHEVQFGNNNAKGVLLVELSVDGNKAMKKIININ